MRIASLLPSATEIVCALGLADHLIAITHECDYPSEMVAGKPVVTGSILSDMDNMEWEAGDDSEADDEIEIVPTARLIDDRVRQALASGESLYRIDIDRLRDLKPDILLTQGLCDVCAVNHKMVVEAANALEGVARIIDLAPTTLTGVLDSFAQVGQTVGREEAAQELIQTTLARLERIRAQMAEAETRPRTLLLDWTEPPYSAGHWNGELIALAGGTGGPWDTMGIPSRVLTWDEIRAFDPEVLVLAACGWDAQTAIYEAEVLANVPGWYDLLCVREGECYAADGNAYFNRPGPRLADSAEILASILHPEEADTILPAYAVLRFPTHLLTTEKPDNKYKKDKKK